MYGKTDCCRNAKQKPVSKWTKVDCLRCVGTVTVFWVCWQIEFFLTVHKKS